MSKSIDYWDDRGSALVELVGFGILLQVPILVFAVHAVNLQRQAFALDAIARHSVRAHVLWPDWESTQQVVSDLAESFGGMAGISVRLQCRPDPKCLGQGLATIETRLGELSASATMPY